MNRKHNCCSRTACPSLKGHFEPEDYALIETALADFLCDFEKPQLII